MDAFFAAVEQRENPEYAGKPIIVGGMPDKRGVVATCSYEARKYGIHSAMPSALAIKLCPKAIFLRPRFDLYKKISLQIREIFNKYTHKIEVVSIDEAYLDVTENKLNEKSATVLAKMIKKEIFNKTHLTASAGVSYNKFLAKIASETKKPDGLFVIPPDKAEIILENLKIEKTDTTPDILLDTNGTIAIVGKSYPEDTFEFYAPMMDWVKEYFETSGFKIWPRFAILARLEEEISEIGRIISVDEGLRQKWKVDNLNYTDEFGDALFQLIHLANQCDVDIDEAVEHVFKK